MNARTGLGRGDGQNKKEAEMEQQPKAARRPLKWALWGAGIVGAVGVAGFLVAPPLVKSIAEESGIAMPQFFGYMWYSALVLLPVFAVVTLLFFL